MLIIQICQCLKQWPAYSSRTFLLDFSQVVWGGLLLFEKIVAKNNFVANLTIYRNSWKKNRLGERFCSPAFFSKQGKLWDQAICSGFYPDWCWKSPRTNTAQLLWVTSSTVQLSSRLKHLLSYKPYTHLLHVCLKLESKNRHNIYF